MENLSNEILYVFCLPAQIVLIIYTLLIIALFKIPVSFSETNYLLEKKANNLGSLFTLFCFIVAIGAGVCMIEVSKDTGYYGLGFAAMCGLSLVGVARFFKEEKNQRLTHYIGAGIAAVSSALFMMLMGEWIILCTHILIAVIATVAFGIKTWLFWAEFALFYAQFMMLDKQFT